MPIEECWVAYRDRNFSDGMMIEGRMLLPGLNWTRILHLIPDKTIRDSTPERRAHILNYIRSILLERWPDGEP